MQKTDNHGRITDTVSMSERPAAVEDRAVPGHWEGDLLFGDRNSQIATLVERHTRYVMLVKVASKDTETVIKALIKNARQLPQELYQLLTWDEVKRWRTTSALRWRPTSASISVIHIVPGSVAAMRI
jgi:IS30 family transposase